MDDQMKPPTTPSAPPAPTAAPKPLEFKLLGKNYVTPDLVAKVTGKARYAEDFRADGMAFCKLLLSPRPHAKVRSVNADAALAMKGVLGILRASDFPAAAPPPGAPPAAARRGAGPPPTAGGAP